MSEKQLSKVVQAMDWAYDKSINGLPKMGTAIELAESYMEEGRSLEDQVNQLIRWQISKTATSGFITGLGGFTTMPISIPANLASIMYMQMRMIAAIAHIGGYDIHDDKVKSLIYTCMAGNNAREVFKGASIQFGTKLTKTVIQRHVTGEFVKRVNRIVGQRFLTKFGTTGVINLGKTIPIAGGVIGGSIDALSTHTIGKVAKKLFITGTQETVAVEINVSVDDHTHEMQDEPKETMDMIEIQKNKLIACINLIKIDNKVAKEEMEVFEAILDESELDTNLKMELSQTIHNKETVPVNFELFKHQPELSTDLIKCLIELAKSDNEVHTMEKMYLKSVAKELDIDIKDITEMLNA